MTAPVDLTVVVEGALCTREAVTAVVQKYGPNVLRTELLPNGDWRILLKPAADGDLAAAVRSDILDQQVRLDLEKRTGNLREAIYHHAFTPPDSRPRRRWYSSR